MDQKTKTSLGWLLVALGALFLISGLVILVSITLSVQASVQADPFPEPSLWTAILNYTLTLLSLEWNPIRIGIFLVLVGLVLEGGGVYVMLAKPKSSRKR
ncbi:MAG: hypothetical protein JW862_15625 [Anaerolineales bacterium]|nr:hypothetical protein [Anaerolineales bacterium]